MLRSVAATYHRNCRCPCIDPFMSAFAFFRRISFSRRLAIAFLCAAFLVNVIAHLTHHHDPASLTASHHAAVCSYCLSFNGVADTPAHAHSLHAPIAFSIVTIFPATDLRTERARKVGQPRGPPIRRA